MKVLINNLEVEVFIERKKNKNTYLRVKDDLNIYITTNYYTTDRQIKKLIKEHANMLIKMRQKKAFEKEKNKKFFYLGKEYDIVYLNSAKIELGEEKVFIDKKMDLDTWYKKEALSIFKKHLDHFYHIFPYSIPYPTLTIRKMKTRWGVCNVKKKRITLNLELIKKSEIYLDYVIVHELSHLIHPNHSKDFWNLVGEVIPNYKTLRKELNHNDS